MSEVNKGVLNRPYLRFVTAAVVVAVAFLLRQTMVHYLGVELPPFITFYPAVMLVALLGGLWPGLLATSLASVLAAYWIFPPIGHFAIASASEAFGLAFFCGMGAFMSLVAERYRRNGKKLAAYREELALGESKEKLRQSEEQFETLANAIPQLCWMANADGWITWYNQRWYEYTGTTPQQMEGWGWQSVHDPDALPKVMERWKASIANGEPFDMVFPLRGSDGVFRPFLTRVMPVKDAEGKVVSWFGTNTDISEQIETAQALRDSEQRYRLLFESMLNGFARCRLIYDQNGRPADFVYEGVNTAFGKLTGLHNVAGKRYSELFPGARELNPELLEVYARVVSTGQPAEFEIYFEPLKIWLSVSAYRTQEEHFVAVFDNITERKQAEQRIAHLASFPELNPNPIFETDLEGKITYVNPAARRKFPTHRGKWRRASSPERVALCCRENQSGCGTIDGPRGRNGELDLPSTDLLCLRARCCARLFRGHHRAQEGRTGPAG